MMYYFWIGEMVLIVAQNVKEAYVKARLYAKDTKHKRVRLMEVA